jgi:hypothetical protein
MLRLEHPDNFKAGAFMGLFGLVMAALCAWGWLNWQDRFWIALQGPTEISPAELAKIDHPSQLPSPWMKLTFEKAYDLELAVTEQSVGYEVVKFKYLLVSVSDRWLIATVKDNFRGNVLAGEMYHMSDQLNNEAFVKIATEHKNIHHDRLFPFEFHTHENFGEWRYFPAVLGLFGAVGIFIGFTGGYMTCTSFTIERPPSPSDENDPTITATNDAIARIMRDANVNRR